MTKHAGLPVVGLRFSASVVEVSQRLWGQVTGTGDDLLAEEEEALCAWLDWRTLHAVSGGGWHPSSNGQHVKVEVLVRETARMILSEVVYARRKTNGREREG